MSYMTIENLRCTKCGRDDIITADLSTGCPFCAAGMRPVFEMVN